MPASVVEDPRVVHSQDEWRHTRRTLNAQRAALTRLANVVYEPTIRLDGTGLLASPAWLPDQPVDLAAIELSYIAAPPEPLIDGSEPAASHTRPCASVARPYRATPRRFATLTIPACSRTGRRGGFSAWIGRLGTGE